MAQVYFGVNNERIAYDYDRTRLKLGSIVHVQVVGGDISGFSPSPSKNSRPYSVTWISPSEWYVSLSDGFHVDGGKIQAVVDAVKGYLDHASVEAALAIAARDIPLKYLYKSKEFKRGKLSVLLMVTERLGLFSTLQEAGTGRRLLDHYLSLSAYLMLTCFDALGQQSDWLSFNDWIESKDKKAEREDALKGKAHLTDPVEGTRLLLGYYNVLYGSTQAFFRFIGEVLPPASRKRLLSTIQIIRSKTPPSSGSLNVTDKHKQDFLFRLRNDYTHSAKYVPGIHNAWFPESEESSRDAWMHLEQTFGEHYWDSVAVLHWPEVLADTVRIGLSQYLLRVLADGQREFCSVDRETDSPVKR